MGRLKAKLELIQEKWASAVYGDLDVRQSRAQGAEIADRGPQNALPYYIEPELMKGQIRFHFAETGVTDVIPLIYKGNSGYMRYTALLGA